MKKLLTLLCVGALLLVAINVQALPLAGEYTIAVTTTSLGANSWNFSYAITNVNQQAPHSIYTGLDGFRIEVPDGATISNVSAPTPYYGSPGYWDYGVNASSIVWYWGQQVQSVYPIGTTATFSFQADGVTLGSNWAQVTTYWNTYAAPNANMTSGQSYYTRYDTELVGPAAIPEPATMLLLGTGLIGLAGLRRRFKK